MFQLVLKVLNTTTLVRNGTQGTWETIIIVQPFGLRISVANLIAK